MAILTEAELVLGLSRHLAAYQMGPERAALEQLEFAGWVFDMAFRLRGSTTNSAERVHAPAAVYSRSTGVAPGQRAAVATPKGVLNCEFTGRIAKVGRLLLRIQNPSNMSSKLIAHTI